MSNSPGKFLMDDGIGIKLGSDIGAA